MTDYSERLKNLDDKKLMDVVKNYRQYGYDDNMRTTAISILNSRGIKNEQLQLTGNFENKTYDYAQKLFDAFNRNSKIAFILFLITLLTNILTPILSQSSQNIATIALLVSFISLIGYFAFLIKSFFNQNQFYKTINQDYGTEGALMYLFLGMPFYVFMYFYFKKQMIEKMKEIK